MIDGLDLVIAQTILSAVPALTGRIGFQPPDEAWRQRVGSGSGVWLNCALVDLREDRHRRSTEIRIERDPLRRVFPPFLMRCHYLISAWNAAKESPAVPAASQEHALLGQVVAALLDASPLTPAAVLLPADLAKLPESWREDTFDTELLPQEGFGKIAEFWGTMGRGTPWRPAAWLAVTVPVEPEPNAIDGVVTTILTSAAAGVPADGAGEDQLAVGGVVSDRRNPAAPVAVPDALVSLTDPAGHLRARAITAADGSFVLGGLVAGAYLAAVRATGMPALGPVPLTLPSPAAGPVELTYT